MGWSGFRQEDIHRILPHLPHPPYLPNWCPGIAGTPGGAIAFLRFAFAAGTWVGSDFGGALCGDRDSEIKLSAAIFPGGFGPNLPPPAGDDLPTDG